MTPSAFERITDALRDAGSTGTWQDRKAQVTCPAHEDREPSLSLTAIEGQALIHCQAGCDWQDVLTAIRLKPADLFDEPRGADYRYLDRAGAVVRTVHRSPAKRFRQSGDTAAQPILYRLPQVATALAEQRPVYLVEGEKDVHALEAMGLVATTAPMGASNFARVDAEPLRGADVTVIPDVDRGGTRWLADVAAKLQGVAASLTVLAPAAGCKDAADHLAAGHGPEQFVPRPPDADGPGLRLIGDDEPPERQLRLTPASTIPIRRVRWLWQGRIAAGSLALLAGREGLGKSTVAYWLTARLTRGELPGEHHGQPRAVLAAATEDSWESTIVPRLIAAGADLDHVYRVEVVTGLGHMAELSLPADLPATYDAAVNTDAAMLLLDPLMSRLASRLDTHKDGEVRQALEPLSRMADSTGMAVLGIIHLNKSNTTDPLNAVMGSVAFAAVARSVSVVVADPDDEADRRRLFGTPKNNLGRVDLPLLPFTVESHEIDTEHEGIVWTGRIDWQDEITGNVREVMARAGLDSDARSATDEAGDWLEDWLVTQGGEADSQDAKRTGVKAGHTVDALKRALRKRPTLAYRSEGMPRHTVWHFTPVGALDVTKPGVDRSVPRARAGGDSPTTPTTPTGSDLQERRVTNRLVGAVGAVGAVGGSPPARAEEETREDLFDGQPHTGDLAEPPDEEDL